MNDRIKGMLYVVAAVFIFSVVNALIKECSARYPINEIVFFRFLPSLIPTAIILYLQEGSRGFRPTAWKFQTLRAISGTFGLGCMFYSFGHMPLADAIAITFSSILFSILVAFPLLKEKPTPRHIVAVLIGFMGVLLIARPSGHVLNIVAIIAVLGAAIDSVTMTTGRKLCLEGASAADIAFYYGVVASVVAGVTLPFWYVMPSLEDFCLLTLMGIGGGIGQYFIAMGFARAPTAIAAPMIYTSMVWSLLFGYAFWGEIPALISIVGISLIIIGGLYIGYLESRGKRAIA